MKITNYSLKMIEKEWYSLKTSLQANQNLDLDPCRCELLLRYTLPCKHLLRRAYESNILILKTLVHPRWWLKGPVLHRQNWQPYYLDEEPAMFPLQQGVNEVDKISREIEQLHEQLQPEEAAHFRRQIVTEHKKLAAIGRSYLEEQAIPINKPDTNLKKQWKKKKEHGKADTRALTGAEIAEKLYYK